MTWLIACEYSGRQSTAIVIKAQRLAYKQMHGSPVAYVTICHDMGRGA
jgi:hypothetical protein